VTSANPSQDPLNELPGQLEYGHLHPHDHPHPEAGRHDPAAAAAVGGAPSAEQAQLGPTEPGTVMLDIGGDIGSLIIKTPPELSGAEIEISPTGRGDARTHMAIRERRSPGGTRWAGIFPGLEAGRYTVWDVSGQPASTVEVVGGEVTQLDWR
jgi:hypothetical protein